MTVATDDSSAFQAALDSISAVPAVLWVPHGHYMLSNTLRLTGVSNFTILGEDPLTTTITWTGPAGSTMFNSSGCSGMNIGRLTWDGVGRAGIAIDITWDEISNYYPTRNYIHDTIIKYVHDWNSHGICWRNVSGPRAFRP